MCAKRSGASVVACWWRARVVSRRSGGARLWHLGIAIIVVISVVVCVVGRGSVDVTNGRAPRQCGLVVWHARGNAMAVIAATAR